MARCIYRITGQDRMEFLQGLITNDINKLSQGMVYAALLTPQGKFIADFFLSAQDDAVLMDTGADGAAALFQRLNMYKLRADVQISDANLFLHRGLGDLPADAQSDPRDAAMGWRAYRDTPAAATTDAPDWDALRVAHCIPETGPELGPDTYILEAGFERLNGVDFRKGCYVGQEVTARMKHKTALRKGFVQVAVQGTAPAGTPIMTQDSREAGVLGTQSGDRALAYLRFDRAKGPLIAGDAQITYPAQ